MSYLPGGDQGRVVGDQDRNIGTYERWDLETLNRPNYIAVEGAIGVGKTTLTRMLAERFDARLVLEEVEENPFLPLFYADPRRYAFQTQLSFLLSRYRQQQEFAQIDLFQTGVVSDYLFAKDRIFAHLTLADGELALYEGIVSLLNVEVIRPDLVIYLQASSERLMERIAARAREYEQNVTLEYIHDLNEAYNHFFFHYSDSPLLVVNTSEVDLASDRELTDDLIAQIESPPAHTRYYMPMER